jgi:hypothetical protein
MKKFKCTVTRTDEFVIELDENVFTEEYMKEFREVFYPFYDLEDHAGHLAWFQAEHDDHPFIEGYGSVLRDGKLPYNFEDYNSDGSKKSEDELAKPCPGVNIITEDNRQDLDVEVKEIE